MQHQGTDSLAKHDKTTTIIVIDDDQEMRSLLEDYLTQIQHHKVISFALATEVLTALQPGGALSLEKLRGGIDAIISDIKMPQMTGLEFTTHIQELRPEIPVILMTAFGSIETAIEAMQKGAFHYIVKPLKLAELGVITQKAIEHHALKQDNQTLRQEIKNRWSYGNVLGKSPLMQSVFDLASRVSQVTANILITGESGTGKEMIARVIHDHGPRKDRPFIAINCSAIPETLLESELFGHAKGSFTGAIQRKKGLFEEAEGGTLFLDEIGDMDILLQSKLLRVIQEKKIRAVGDNQTKDVDVRIITATHKDLKLAIKEGRFREDLFYRLSVIPVVIPALRQRPEDIPLLADYFLKKIVSINNLKINGFSKGAMAKLCKLKWEGNVRELENVIERVAILCRHPVIDESDIPNPEIQSPDSFFSDSTVDYPTISVLEERYIKLILNKTNGKKDKAAQILGINRRTLYRKEKELGLVDPSTKEPESDD